MMNVERTGRAGDSDERANGYHAGLSHRLCRHHHLGHDEYGANLDREGRSISTASLMAYGEPSRPYRREGGDIVQLPSFDNLDQLERDVHRIGQAGTTVNPESGPMLSAAATLTGAQAELNGVARRQLPTVVLWLLIFTAALSAAVMGIVATNVRRPYLILGWALVGGIGISVVLSLYNPFAGTVAVDFQPLVDAALRIRPN